jgi:hypothetical protein
MDLVCRSRYSCDETLTLLSVIIMLYRPTPPSNSVKTANSPSIIQWFMLIPRYNSHNSFTIFQYSLKLKLISWPSLASPRGLSPMTVQLKSLLMICLPLKWMT